jgi:formamidopyrimidine-DNA glycosylase
LYFTDARNFGTIVITSDKSVLDKRLNKLAPDILRSNMTNEQLLEITKQYISKSRANKNVVKVLMNQNAIVSGIGNYLVAEILYDARISPFTNLNEISSNKLKKLVHSMRKITKMAYYDNITGYMVNFKEFGNNHLKMVEDRVFPNYLPDIVGKKFRFNVYQQEKDSKGNIVKRDEIVKGRTIHWVPSVQT